MSHQIQYFDLPKSKYSEYKIVKDVCKFAYDPMESSWYHGQMTFHLKPIYKTREEAMDAIKRLDRGWYDDHTVVYKCGRKHYWLVKVEWHC